MRAETAFVFPTGQAWCEMVAQLAFRQPKGLCRQQHGGSKPATRDLLAIAAMAFEHHDRFSRAFVANLAASAASGKWYFRNR